MQLSLNIRIQSKEYIANSEVLAKEAKARRLHCSYEFPSSRASRIESALAWLRLNRAGLLVILLVLTAIGIVYGNELAILANEALQNEAFSHILIFPFLLGFLFYLKKDTIKATLSLNRYSRSSPSKYVNEMSGAALCLLALVIYWYGSSTFYPLEYHIASLPVFVSGIVLIIANPRTLRMLIFPILFIFFLVPLPTTIVYTAGGALAGFNTQIAFTILKAVGMPVSLSTVYGAPMLQLATVSGQPMNFSVDVPCSGIYSLIAFIMIISFIMFISSTTILKKSLIFISGFSLFWGLNLLRILGVLSVANWFGEQNALIIHGYAGIILIFVGILLILGFSQKILKVQLRAKPSIGKPCPKCQITTSKTKEFCSYCGRFLNNTLVKFPRNTLLKLLVLIIACSVAVLSINAPTFIISGNNLELYSAVDPQKTNTNVFPNIYGYTLLFLYRDTAYEQIARQDAALMYGYYPINATEARIYADIGISGSMTTLHNWEVCYVAYQTAQGKTPLAEVLDSSEVELLPETSLIAKYFVFNSPQNYTQVTLYWFGKANFKTELTTVQKYYRISLLIIAQNADDVPKYKEQLFIVAQNIASALEPLKSQAALSLGIPAIQYTIVGLVAFIGITKFSQNIIEKKKRSTNRTLFHNFASKKEKIVLNTIRQISETHRYIKTNEIVERIERKIGKAVNPNRVHSILKTLEENGFISTTVVSNENSPSLVWETRESNAVET